MDAHILIAKHKAYKKAEQVLNKEESRHYGQQLAAAVLAQAFKDLESPNLTKYIYAEFFRSDYCKLLFDIANVVYDREKIERKIENRPLQAFTESFDDEYLYYKFTVKNGYIETITNVFNNEICRLENNDSEANYYYPMAMSLLRRRKYKIVPGV